VMQRLAARVQMSDELMTEEVEIHPFGGAAALRALEELAVETPRGAQVVDGNGEVEGFKRHRRNDR
jgi:hypothetical protein